MAPIDMQRVTHGTKGRLELAGIRTILPRFVGVTQAVQPTYPLCGMGGMGPLWWGHLRGGCYLRWRARVLSRTSSNMLGSWNLPMSLIRNGSLTLMCMASLMFLVSHVVCHSQIMSVLIKIFCFMQFTRSLLYNIGNFPRVMVETKIVVTSITKVIA